MRVMITGGAGFLGAWIARRLLQDGHEVRIFDRSQDRGLVRRIAGAPAEGVGWVVGDVTDPGAVLAGAAGTDAIIHLAALLTPACRADPVLGARVNLIGTLNAFSAARALGHRVLAYASSAGVFGPETAETPGPTTHYGAFKLACEGCARAFWIEDGLASVGFRPLVVYGPGREVGSSAGITLACAAAARGQPFTVGFTGATDLVYVEDVAAAFAAAATRPVAGAHVLNLPGERARVDDALALIGELAPGARLGSEGEPLPIADLLPDSDAASLLGLPPRTALREGIARTLAFYRATGT